MDIARVIAAVTKASPDLASHVFLEAVIHEAPDVRRPGTVRGPPRRNHVATRSAAVHLRADVRVPTADDHVGAQTGALFALLFW